ncbi:GIY-YIG nuclease family protein, partial [Solirubrobacter sp. CPCC 204708]|nr:GIY-YIG nuclease family protein [Solirubrobacter deserti]
MNKEFFPARPAATPTIYAYEDSHPEYKGMLKVGYTARSAAARVAQQYPTAKPGKQPYTIVLEESAMRSDGSAFTDHDVHRALMQAGVKRKGGEWFACTAKQVRAAIVALREREEVEQTRDLDFGMRPEQAVAVEKTAYYFNSFGKDKINKGKAPHFLWNAKMRFGKTFASYQLAKK